MSLEVHVPNGVGLHSTKGDEVIRSLARLLDKIHMLETRKHAVQEYRDSDLNEHIALVEAQCSLLEEQLRCARRMLTFSSSLRASPDPYYDGNFKEPYRVDDVDSHFPTMKPQDNFASQLVFAARNMRGKEHDSDIGTSLAANTTMVRGSAKPRPPPKVRRTKSTSDAAFTHRTSQRPDQCKLSLGDIPFILGKSTTASHSLPANLQNLVSLLKKTQPISDTRKGAAADCRRPMRFASVGCLPRSNSDHNLHRSSQLDGPSKDLVDLLCQGEQLLRQLQRHQVPGTRHSLKCQSRRLIVKIEAKLNDIKRQELQGVAVEERTRTLPTRKNEVTKPRASTFAGTSGDFNRIFLRELKKIQGRLEEQV
ncbi:centrosomal protein of 57 kDa isoform X1 [Ixodes scapularis]|uniref:centrosomal protein of 57 kDa isoform X1 n=1 Tax=Ixodes scapularis TaxID=6945 RepID=UPI001A9E128A|nr:centrosomal protein of 57 kDa isoform X1 [Ixodes scapularis]